MKYIYIYTSGISIDCVQDYQFIFSVLSLDMSLFRTKVSMPPSFKSYLLVLLWLSPLTRHKPQEPNDKFQSNSTLYSKFAKIFKTRYHIAFQSLHAMIHDVITCQDIVDYCFSYFTISTTLPVSHMTKTTFVLTNSLCCHLKPVSLHATPIT